MDPKTCSIADGGVYKLCANKSHGTLAEGLSANCSDVSSHTADLQTIVTVQSLHVLCTYIYQVM
jgi:hypothetical protein